MGAEVRLESHLVKDGVGAERNGDGVDHQQHRQQQLKGPVSEQLLDIHSSDELLHVPGILREGRRPFFRQVSRRRPLPGCLLSVSGAPWGGPSQGKGPKRESGNGRSVLRSLLKWLTAGDLREGHCKRGSFRVSGSG